MATDTYVTDVSFAGNRIITTVTSSGAAVEGWLRQIRRVYHSFYHRLIVGLDAEWRPSYTRGKSNPVALLQLCVGRRCLVFQILHADFVPEALARFLAEPRFRFVGVGVRGDANLLSYDHGLQVGETVDLRGLVAEEMHRPELRQAGLQALVRAVMGADLQKPRRVTMGPWDAHYLSDEQVKYASIDAFVSFEIGRKLLTGDYPPADFEPVRILSAPNLRSWSGSERTNSGESEARSGSERTNSAESEARSRRSCSSFSGSG